MPPQRIDQLPSRPSSSPLKNSNDHNGRRKCLRETVVNLHWRLKQILSEREYYAEQSIELRGRLQDRLPEQAITVETLQVADMLVEIDDLRDKVRLLESTSITPLIGDTCNQDENLSPELEGKDIQNNVIHGSNVVGMRHSIDLPSPMQQQIFSSEENGESVEKLRVALQARIRSLEEENANLLKRNLEDRTKHSEDIRLLQIKVSSLEDRNKTLQSGPKRHLDNTLEEVNLQAKVRALEWDKQVLQKEKESMKTIRVQLDEQSRETEELRKERVKDHAALEDAKEENYALKSQVDALTEEMSKLHSTQSIIEHLMQAPSRSQHKNLNNDNSCVTMSTPVPPPPPTDQTVEDLRNQVKVLEEVLEKMALQCSNNETIIASLTEQIANKALFAMSESEPRQLVSNGVRSLVTNQPRLQNLKRAATRVQGGVRAVAKKYSDVLSEGTTTTTVNNGEELPALQQQQPAAPRMLGGRVGRILRQQVGRRSGTTSSHQNGTSQ